MRDIEGKRVLLLDDVYTSGASIQSAASTLALAGARVIAGVVVARFINPDFAPNFITQLKQRPYDFAACCLPGCPANSASAAEESFDRL
jgi:hypoxanthine phosphoribosyltransferase